jgi:hypothetical protein
MNYLQTVANNTRWLNLGRQAVVASNHTPGEYKCFDKEAQLLRIVTQAQLIKLGKNIEKSNNANLIVDLELSIKAFIAKLPSLNS